MVKKSYRTNQYIRAQQLRVIGADGKQVGILSLSEALKKSQEENLDLVEIVPQANPPVAKIIDFKKFLYQEDKKEREAKRNIKGGEVKGIRLKPFIAQADLEVRIKRAEEFLKEGNKVRVAVRFTGRLLGKKEFGYDILNRFTEMLSACSKAEGTPKWLGRELVLTLTPFKGKGEENAKEAQNQEINHPQV